MSVNPGFGGQAFIPSALDKLREVRRQIDASGKSIRLEIDGGVKADNIGEIAAAGADTFVAGSAIFNAPDYAAIGAMRERSRARGEHAGDPRTCATRTAPRCACSRRRCAITAGVSRSTGKSRPCARSTTTRACAKRCRSRSRPRAAGRRRRFAAARAARRPARGRCGRERLVRPRRAGRDPRQRGDRAQQLGVKALATCPARPKGAASASAMSIQVGELG